jgi:arylsulfatase A-like enzyme
MSRRPAISVLLVVSALAWIGCVQEPVARNIIVVSLDTVRADHLGTYGYPADTSPSLDAFAARGAVFENVWTTAPWTLPAHASLLTGLYPTHHGVRYEKHSLGAEIPSVSEILNQAGFRTGAVVNSIFLSPSFGLGRGYERYEKFAEDHGRKGAAGRVTDAALAFLRANRGKRVFLFVHYFDVHSDYRSDRRIEESFGGRKTWVNGTTKQLAELMNGTKHIDEAREIAALVGLYDAGIRQLDDELGRFFDALAAEVWLVSTQVVVTTDHGEELLEHGSVVHGATHYEEVLRVPLVLHGPGVPVGVRVVAPVSIVDVLPTVLDFVGVESPTDLDGISLRGAWRSPVLNRLIFAEANRAPKVGSRVAVRQGRHKLLFDIESGERELYDLESDPAETRNRVDEDPQRAEMLHSALDALQSRRVDDATVGDVSEQMRERLRVLGYEESEGAVGAGAELLK